MTNVGTIIARTTQTALGVHVRTIHENLATVRMHDLADFADRWFEHPCVEGYVTISAARSRACSSALARRSARSMSPSFKQATETTLNPAMTALAGLVPCAEVGIRQTLRSASPRAA